MDRRRVTAVLLVSVGLVLALNAGLFLYGCHVSGRPSLFLNYDELRPCGTEPLYEPHPYLSYQHNTGATEPYRINAYGYRGPALGAVRNRTSVLTIGGSAVFGLGVGSWHQDLARQLADRLSGNGTTVTGINGGAVGYTSWESMINLATKGRAIDPEYVVIYQGLNDVWTRLVPPSRYRADNTGYRRNWAGIGPDTTLYRVLLGHRLYLKELTTTERYSRQRSRLRKNPPRYFRSNTATMIAVARQIGAEPVLVTYPTSDRYQEYATTGLFQTGIRQHNNVTRRLGARLNVTVVDLAARMPEAPRFWSSSRHPSARGTRYQARLIAASIRR